MYDRRTVAGVGSQSDASQVQRLSETLWGVAWDSFLPCDLGEEGISVELASADTVASFVSDHYGVIFGDPGQAGFWRDPDTARGQYLRYVCDAFAFRHHGALVGVFVSNPVDWATYYIRSVAFIKEYQGRGLVQRFNEVLCAVLQSKGVVRVEVDTAPSNQLSVGALLGQHFVLSGTVLSERWGALSRFTKFLDASAEDAYLARFCESGALHKRRRAGSKRAAQTG
jgi:hypothetical protein